MDQEPTAKACGLVMVVTMQILTRLSNLRLLPVSGYQERMDARPSPYLFGRTTKCHAL
ncbi:MAG: hypothetical protein WED07_10165 [Candidatus Freyarchaeum deiterrae]